MSPSIAIGGPPVSIDGSCASIEDGKAALSKHPAGLNEQTAIDRLVGHLITLAFRMGSVQPAGYLLGRPISSQLAGHRLSQPGISRQLTAFRAAGSFPGILVSQRRSVAVVASIPARSLPADRQGSGPATSHRSCRSIYRNASPISSRSRASAPTASGRRGAGRAPPCGDTWK